MRLNKQRKVGPATPAVIYLACLRARIKPRRAAKRRATPSRLSSRHASARLKVWVRPSLNEFVDRRESAKTADRPELQRMLQFIKENPVKYVIVHKVDRLARDRADDVAINLAIQRDGAELVCVCENIDQTPSGLLLHGIMSSISSVLQQQPGDGDHQGLRAEGQERRHAQPGTVGYLNVRNSGERPGGPHR